MAGGTVWELGVEPGGEWHNLSVNLNSAPNANNLVHRFGTSCQEQNSIAGSSHHTGGDPGQRSGFLRVLACLTPTDSHFAFLLLLRLDAKRGRHGGRLDVIDDSGQGQRLA